jgi:hypothetical protein
MNQLFNQYKDIVKQFKKQFNLWIWAFEHKFILQIVFNSNINTKHNICNL